MKYKNIVFDLDGVIRDLLAPIEKMYGVNIDSWIWKNKDNIGVCELINSDTGLLLQSPATKYANIIKKYFTTHNTEIWTHQPLSWRPNTIKWVNNFFYPLKINLKFYNPSKKYKQLYEKKYIIIEDSPKFERYDRIILIDTPYNQNIKNPMARIKTIKQLKEILI